MYLAQNEPNVTLLIPHSLESLTHELVTSVSIHLKWVPKYFNICLFFQLSEVINNTFLV